MTEVCLKPRLQILLTTLFCGEGGKADAVYPVLVQEVQLGAVQLADKEVCRGQSDLVLRKSCFTVLAVDLKIGNSQSPEVNCCVVILRQMIDPESDQDHSRVVVAAGQIER